MKIFLKKDKRGRILLTLSKNFLKPCLSIPINKKEWTEIDLEGVVNMDIKA